MEKEPKDEPKEILRCPWKCPSCGWFLYKPKTEPCPCQANPNLKNLEKPPKLPSSFTEKKKQQVNQSHPQKRKVVGVYNVGTINQKDGNKGLPEKPHDATRFVVISDTHSLHGSLLKIIPNGDVLIHAGDITISGSQKTLQDFCLFLDALPHKHKIVIAGNHDAILATDWYSEHYWRFHEEKLDAVSIKSLLKNHCIYLEDEEVVVDNIRVYGSPWIPARHDWAFCLYDENHLKFAWDLIPDGIDILVTHTPPQGIRSSTPSGVEVGCPFLKQALKRVKPIVHVFGHVHSGYGVQKGTPLFVNGCVCNAKYKPVNAPIVFDLL